MEGKKEKDAPIEYVPHMTFSVGTTQHWPVFPPPMVSLTLLFDHHGGAEPVMNGLTEWTRTPTSSQYLCCAPHRRWGRNTSSESVATRGCKRDTVRGGTVATGVSHPLMGKARSSRVARDDGAWFHMARRLRTRCLGCVAAEAPQPASPTFSVWP